MLWWAFVHNPKKIKSLTTERDHAISQKEAAFAAINMLGEIRKAQDEINKQSNENMARIRKTRPRRDGVFISAGVLPTVYKAYSTSGSTTPIPK